MSGSLTAEQKLAVLQRFIDKYAEDLLAVQGALGDASTPDAAKRVLVGGLNYGLDMLDMFPDHYKGLGVADDVIVLRLAAKQAVAAGASHAALLRLADEAGDVAAVFEDLAAPLEKFVAKLPEREARGRSVDKILTHRDTRIMFEADVAREAKRHKPQPIDTSVGGPERALVELRKMTEHGLRKAGILE